MVLANRMRKTICLHWSHNEEGRFRTYHIIVGNLEERRGKGGGGTQKEQMMANLATRMNLEMTTSVISATWDEGVWKRMVDKALEAGHLIITIMVQKQNLIK